MLALFVSWLLIFILALAVIAVVWLGSERQTQAVPLRVKDLGHQASARLNGDALR